MSAPNEKIGHSGDNEPPTPLSLEPTGSDVANAQEPKNKGALKEEEKLDAKYPTGLRGPGGGRSVLLHKFLQRPQKFFDSGDYQMAKQRGQVVSEFAHKLIPTPETVTNKTAIAPPDNKFVSKNN